MEICYLLRGIVNIFRILPAVVLYSVTFPFHQVLQFPPEHPTVQDFFHKVFLFTLNKFRGGRRVPLPSGDGVLLSQRQFHNIENRVKTSHGKWKGQAVSMPSDTTFNWVWAEPTV
jgi:hypothetical protein